MNNVSEEFVSSSSRRYGFQMGKKIASSLSGFLAGAIFASIVWILIFFYYQAMQ